MTNPREPESNKVLELQEEVKDLRTKLSIRMRVDELCTAINKVDNASNINGTKIELLEGKVKAIESDIKDIKTSQIEAKEERKVLKQLINNISDVIGGVNLTMQSFIGKHKYDLIKWALFGILTLSTMFVGLYVTQRDSIEKVRDDIIKILVEKKLNEPRETKTEDR